MKISQNDRKKIIAVLQSEEKFTYKELGRKYGVHAAHIGKIYREETGMLLRPIKRLSQDDKETIVAEIQAKKTSMIQLAKRYGVDVSRISLVFKKMTGSALYPRQTVGTAIPVVSEQQKKRVQNALKESRYQAQHKEEKKRYSVVGIDWFNQQLLLFTDGLVKWHPMDRFSITECSEE